MLLGFQPLFAIKTLIQKKFSKIAAVCCLFMGQPRPLFHFLSFQTHITICYYK